MANILALVDGSVYARSVCEHAAWAANRLQASVDLVHVLGRRETDSTPSDLSGSLTLGARTALLEELAAFDEQRARLAQKRGRVILEDAKAAVEAQGVEQVTTKLRIGDIVETVAELETDTDMVLIGKRGEGADFAHGHLGSNLERIARSSTKPTFVASRAFQPIERFLIAYDGGMASMKAVDHVARSPLFAGLECRLITIGAQTTENERRLQGAQSILEGAGYAVKADVLPGTADTVIAQAVENEKIGLLVMGAYGHSRLRTLVIGSTTSEMVRSCKIPVVLFR